MTKAQINKVKLGNARRRMRGDAFEPTPIGLNKYRQYVRGDGHGSSQCRIDTRRVAANTAALALKQAA